MNELTPAALNDFLERFHRCDDAVIRSLSYVFGGVRQSRVTVEISTQDAASDTGWSNLMFHILDVREVVLKEGATTNVVMSSGIYVGWFDGLVFVDFSPYSTEMETATDVRQSTFYVAGRACFWEVLPYAEGGT